MCLPTSDYSLVTKCKIWHLVEHVSVLERGKKLLLVDLEILIRYYIIVSCCGYDWFISKARLTHMSYKDCYVMTYKDVITGVALHGTLLYEPEWRPALNEWLPLYGTATVLHTVDNLSCKWPLRNSTFAFL